MLDAAGAVLYVGKAINLRRRLSTYAGRSPALDRRLEGLAARVMRVEVRETPSDLEATLLEARLLARHMPLFNVARQVHRGARYIRLALGDDPPRVHLVHAATADGARYVGPLRSARQAQQALAVARLACPAAFGRHVPDLEARRRAVQDVALLLGGQKEKALEALRVAMRHAAAAGDAPAVDRARDGLRRVLDLTLEPSLLIGLGANEPLLIVEQVADDGLRAHLVVGGRHAGATDLDAGIWAGHADQVGAAVGAIASMDIAPAAADDPALAALDEQTVILRWLSMSKSVLGVYPVPA
jgi:hypothetical protein